MGTVYPHETYITVAPSTSVTNYNSFGPIAAWSTSATDNLNVMGGDGATVLDQVTITLANAPGAGKSWTFTLVVAGSDTSVVVVVSGTDPVGTDLVNSASINPGQTYGWKCVPSGTPAATGNIHRRVRWTCSGTQMQMVSCPSTTSHTEVAGTSYFMAFDVRGNQPNTVAGERACQYPWQAGKARKFYVDLETNPGVGKTVTVTFRINGVDTLAVIVITNATSGSYTATDITVADGDLLSYRVDVGLGATTTRARVGAQFVSTAADGNIVWLGQSAATSGNTVYVSGNATTTTDESKWLTMPACTMSKMYAKLTTILANLQVTTLTVRKSTGSGFSDQTLVVTATGDNVNYIAANDTTHSVSFNDGDLQTVKHVAGTTASSGVDFTYVLFFAQASAVTLPMLERFQPRGIERGVFSGF